MAVKYKVTETAMCMTADQLNEETKGGWSLVSHSSSGMGSFCYVFQYVGGLGSSRAVISGN